MSDAASAVDRAPPLSCRAGGIAAVAAAAPQDFPKLKPGLWEVTHDGRAGATASRRA